MLLSHENDKVPILAAVGTTLRHIMEEAGHRRPRAVQFHVREIATRGKPIETQSTALVPRGWGWSDYKRA